MGVDNAVALGLAVAIAVYLSVAFLFPERL
jgi:hypothetical protein